MEVPQQVSPGIPDLATDDIAQPMPTSNSDPLNINLLVPTNISPQVSVPKIPTSPSSIVGPWAEDIALQFAAQTRSRRPTSMPNESNHPLSNRPKSFAAAGSPVVHVWMPELGQVCFAARAPSEHLVSGDHDDHQARQHKNKASVKSPLMSAPTSNATFSRASENTSCAVGRETEYVDKVDTWLKAVAASSATNEVGSTGSNDRRASVDSTRVSSSCKTYTQLRVPQVVPDVHYDSQGRSDPATSFQAAVCCKFLFSFAHQKKVRSKKTS